MSWKLVSLGSLLAVITLSGCSTSDSGDKPRVECGHSRCEAQSAVLVIG